MIDVMLDTSAVNRILDTGVDPESLAIGSCIYLTHIQVNELQATRNEERLRRLLDVAEQIPHFQIPTSVAVWGVSEWGGAEFDSNGDGRFGAMLASLNERNRAKPNNQMDALIGITALRRNLTLVTNDRDLLEVVREFGGSAMTSEEFLAHAR